MAASTWLRMMEAGQRRIVIAGDDPLASEGLAHVLSDEIDPAPIAIAAKSDAIVYE